MGQNKDGAERTIHSIVDFAEEENRLRRGI
jgi:hypothetical protein